MANADDKYFPTLDDRITLVEPIIPNSSSLTSVGDSVSPSFTTIGEYRGPEGFFLELNTDSVNGSIASLQGQTIHRRKYNPIMSVLFFLRSITNVRFFCGLTNQLDSVMLSADDPSGHYAGIQYSTIRGDTTFKYVRKDGTTQVIANSIAVDINVHKLKMWLHPDSDNRNTNKISIQLDNDNRGLYTTNLPTDITDLRFVIGVRAENIAIKTFRFARLLIIERL